MMNTDVTIYLKCFPFPSLLITKGLTLSTITVFQWIWCNYTEIVLHSTTTLCLVPKQIPTLLDLSAPRVQMSFSQGLGSIRNFSGAYLFVSSKRRRLEPRKLSSYFNFLFPLQHTKRPALQNKRVGVLRMAFRVRKVFGTSEKLAPGSWLSLLLPNLPLSAVLFLEHFIFCAGSPINLSSIYIITAQLLACVQTYFRFVSLEKETTTRSINTSERKTTIIKVTQAFFFCTRVRD